MTTGMNAGADPAPGMMRWLELKVPPPVVALLVALAMWGIVRRRIFRVQDKGSQLALSLQFGPTGRDMCYS
jgi:hypothetical protein